MTTLALRPYQMEIIANVRDAMKRHKRVVLHAPTGAGKTAMASYMAGQTAERGRNVFFMCHRRELIRQASSSFAKWGVRHCIIADGRPIDTSARVHIASVGSFANLLDSMPITPDLMIWDECHHIAAETWGTIQDRFADAWHIGLSATPERLDGAGLRAHFQTLVPGPKVSWLIEQGYLANFVLHTVSPSDFGKALIGDVVEHWREHANGLRTVAFCKTVVHSLGVVEGFNAAGIPAAHLDSNTPAAERKAKIQAFARGEIMVLSNVDLFGEGFDLAAIAQMDVTIDAVILLRQTQSLSLYLQWCGRALRPSPGKVAVILDHAGNKEIHGYPDEHHEWNLDGRIKRSRDLAPLLPWDCPQCFKQTERVRGEPMALACWNCGKEIPTTVRITTIEHLPGKLIEAKRTAALQVALAPIVAVHGTAAFDLEDLLPALPSELQGAASNDIGTALRLVGFEKLPTKGTDKARWRKVLTEDEKTERKKEERQCKSLDELIELGKRRGYANAGKWATHKWGARPVRLSS